MTDTEFMQLVETHAVNVIVDATLRARFAGEGKGHPFHGNQSFSKARMMGAASHPYRHIHKAADAHVSAVRAVVQKAFKAGADRASYITKSEEMTEKTFEPAVVTMMAELRRTLGPALREVFWAGGHAAAKVLGGQLRGAELRAAKAPSYPSPVTGLKFDETNPEAVKWAMEHAAELVTEIGETTRGQIKKAIVNGFSLGMTVDEVAAEIDDVLDDVTRAELIARTETISAANAGQQELWSQAVEDGYLTGDEQQVWITTPDDRLCPICEGLEAETAPMGGTFDADGEEVDGPPAHPNCRCALGLQVESVTAAQSGRRLKPTFWETIASLRPRDYGEEDEDDSLDSSGRN